MRKISLSENGLSRKWVEIACDYLCYVEWYDEKRLYCEKNNKILNGSCLQQCQTYHQSGQICPYASVYSSLLSELQWKYEVCKEKQESAKTEEEFQKLYLQFKELENYRDAEQQAQKCFEQYNKLKKR